jgi:hypothetical protein
MDEDTLSFNDVLSGIAFGAFTCIGLSRFFQEALGLSEEDRSLLALGFFSGIIQPIFVG